MSQLFILDPKDPNAVIDYDIDWSKRLPNGDIILVSDWIVPAGITMDSEESTDTVTKIWLSGGTAGQSYALTNRITTAHGRTQDKTITITVKEL